MGCNMCLVQKPEEQYRVMFQVNGKELSRLSGDPTLDMRDPVLSNLLRRGTRRRTTLGGGLGAPGVSGAVTMGVADCVDSCTQTDISFQHMLTLGKSSQHPCGAPPSPDPPPSPPLPPLLDPYLLNELLIEPEYYDPNDYFDITQHEVDRQDELEYEEVELYKSRQQDKLGLTVCYRTDDEEDLGIYVGEVNPNSIAAVDGRIREGDRILQINGIDIQNREEAVAILTREDSTNIFLLLARPEIENDNQLDPDELELEPLDNALHLTSHHRLAINSSSSPLLGPAAAGVRGSRDSPGLLQTLLSNSQELDSGVGRTDESTRYEESSEHDLLGDEHTSAPNTDATNTPGSMRKFTGHADTPPLLLPRDLQLSADSLPGLEPPSVTTTTATPGLTEEECERYRELLEIRCYYERNNNNGFLLQGGEPGGGATPLDVNRNEGLMQHELALVEEELRHLEFKYRNILRAQKMQQLRERCLKAWPPEEQQEEEEGQGPGVPEEPRHHVLSDINELPERWDKDSSSAYNTGGDSCRSTPLLGEQHPPSPSMHSLHAEPGADALPAPGSRHRERGGGGRVGLPQPCSPGPHVREAGAKFRARRASDGGARRSPSKAAGAGGRAGGRSAENSPCLARRQAPQRYRSCLHLGSPSEDGARGPEPPPPPPRMEWKVKIRSDGSRYVAKRPVRDRLLKARAIKIREERSGMTTDDDAVSEMKMGRYWSKEERKQQLLRAREHRRRREFMMQSRLDCLRDRGEGDREGETGTGEGEAGAYQQGATTLPLEPPSILELCHRRSMKKRSRRILDNWITIQELLAHGTRSPDGKKIYNPLLSVTTV